MPMIGGERGAERPMRTMRGVRRWTESLADAGDLGWVTDWLYGDGLLPPAPLPREEAPPYAAPTHAPSAGSKEHARAGAHRARSPARRRAKQLALL
jgi:hypothetical protein